MPRNPKAEAFFTVERCKQLNSTLKEYMCFDLTGKQIREVVMARGNSYLRNQMMRYYPDGLRGLDTAEREIFCGATERFLLGEKLTKRLRARIFAGLSEETAYKNHLVMLRGRQRGWKIIPEWKEELDRFLDNHKKGMDKYNADHGLTAEEITERILAIKLDDRYNDFMIIERVNNGLLTEKQLSKGPAAIGKENLVT